MEKETIFIAVPICEDDRWKEFDDAFEYLHGKTFSPSEELPFKNAADFLYKIEDKFDVVDELFYYDNALELCNGINSGEYFSQDVYKIALVNLEYE